MEYYYLSTKKMNTKLKVMNVTQTKFSTSQFHGTGF